MTGRAPAPWTVGWPLYLGMAVAGAAAVVASASTLAALARTAGWSGWTPWLLPAALDVGGSAGGWCWLRPGSPPRAQRFGRVVALVGAAGTLVGNAAGHLIASGYLTPGPLLVVVVGAVPAAVLMALAHLAALLATAPAAPATPAPRPRPHRAEPAKPAPAPAVSTPTSSGAPTATHAGDGVSEPVTAPIRRLAIAAPPAAPSVGDDVAGTRTAVLTAIDDAPATVADLVRATGRSRTTIVGHLTALTEDGTVVRGDDKRYRLAPVADPETEAARR